MSPNPDQAISTGRITLLLAGLVAVLPFAVDMYLPAMAAMAADLGSSVHYLEQSISSFFVGIAIGQLVGAPFSDRIGRRKPVFIGLLIFVISSVILTQSDTAFFLIAWRFVQAFGAGVAAVNAAAIVRDIFDEIETARLFANIAVVMMIAPLISPIIGAYLLELFGWQSIFMFLATYASIVIVTMYAKLPETRYLRQRPIDKAGYRKVLASPWSNALAVSIAFSSVSFFLYLADSSFIFLEYYGLSPTEFAWLFAAGVLLLIFAHRTNRWLLTKTGPRRILMYAIPTQAILTVLMFAYSHLVTPDMWVFYALIMLVASITQIITSNGMAIYLSLHPDHAGKANAILGSFRFGVGGIFGFALAYFHNSLTTTFTTLVMIASLIGVTVFALVRSRSNLFRF